MPRRFLDKLFSKNIENARVYATREQSRDNMLSRTTDITSATNDNFQNTRLVIFAIAVGSIFVNFHQFSTLAILTIAYMCRNLGVMCLPEQLILTHVVDITVASVYKNFAKNWKSAREIIMGVEQMNVVHEEKEVEMEDEGNLW